MTHSKAMLCALAAFFSWVLVDAVIKYAGLTDLSPFAIIGIMGIIGAAGVAASALSNKNIRVLYSHNPRKQILLCLTALTTNYVNVIALKHLPLTIFYVVVFLIPLGIAAASSFLKHEVLTKTKIACLIAGFVGVLIAIAPRMEYGDEWIGYVAALTSLTSFVTYTILIKTIAQTESSESMLFWNALVYGSFGVLCSAHSLIVMNFKLLMIIVAGGLINVVGNALYNKALKYTTSTNVAQLHYTQIISGAFIGYVMWNEIPTWNLIFGSALIIASGMIVAAQAHNAENRT